MTTTDALAQREAELSYAAAYDRFADLEQAFASVPPLAHDAHDKALLVISAYRAEMDDREVGSEIMQVEPTAALGEVAAILHRHWVFRHDTNAREGWR